MSETPQSDNLPAGPGTTPDPVQRGERRGMFGARRGGDTSGYGGLRTPILFPGASEKPYGGYYDELTGTLETALDAVGGTSFGAAVERVVEAHTGSELDASSVEGVLAADRWARRHATEIVGGGPGVDRSTEAR